MRFTLPWLLTLTLPVPAQTVLPPLVSSAGLVNAAGGAIHSPGSLLSVFGSNFAGSSALGQANASGDLPRSLAGVSLSIGGRNAALLFVGPAQINAQIPNDLPAGAYDLRVNNSAGSSAPVTLSLAAASPGIFPNAIVRSTTYAAPTQSDPARPSDILLIFCAGLGPVNPTVPSGRVAPAAPFSHTVEKPKVFIGGREAELIHAVLAPGYLGLYQVAFRVPDGLSAGVNPVQIVMGSLTSNEVGVFAAHGGQDLPPRITSVKSSVFSKTGGRYLIGSFVRIDVVEASGSSTTASGTVRVTSESPGPFWGQAPISERILPPNPHFLFKWPANSASSSPGSPSTPPPAASTAAPSSAPASTRLSTSNDSL